MTKLALDGTPAEFGLKDVLAIEGEAESEEDYYESLQHAIDSGTAWSMQGSMGRAMMAAIESGRCRLGPNPTHDYYGNRTPAYWEVQPGSMGSPEYVEAHSDD